MRLKNVDVGEGSLSPEQITEFIDQMQVYEGAMYEISTKLEILDSEFQVRFSHNPIHHMERRLKSLNSILGKLQRRNLPLTVDAIKDNLFDVAGVRVICNYRDDVYSVANYLSAQSDIQVLRVKDYIKNPKQNGYRSLHVIYAVPVFLSSGPHYTPVEVQLRTIAMDIGQAWSMRCGIRRICRTRSLPSIRRRCWIARAACRTSRRRCRTSIATSTAPRVWVRRRRRTDVFGKWRLTDKSLPVNRHFSTISNVIRAYAAIVVFSPEPVRARCR